MFGEALDALAAQAKPLEINLDFIIVINNGGSHDSDISSELSTKLPALIQEKLPNHCLDVVETRRPETALEGNPPWIFDSDLSREAQLSHRSSGKVILVKQPHHPLNRGKISALRDGVSFLREQILKHGYDADFVFQMDAETILRFRKPPLQREISPFCELYSFFAQNNYAAVGTRDRFFIFDPASGLPLPIPIVTLQVGWEIVNSNRPIISLSGGALMAKTASYVAAIGQLATQFPALITEDLAYTYTRLLQTLSASQDRFYDDMIALHPDIEHINRTPAMAQPALSQLETWARQSNAVDAYFPGFEFVPMNSIKMSLLIFVRRIAEIREYGISSILRLIEDLINFRTATRIAFTKDCANIRCSR